MLYLTCTTIISVDLSHYGVSRAKDWVSVDCGTNTLIKQTDFLARKRSKCRQNTQELIFFFKIE